MDLNGVIDVLIMRHTQLVVSCGQCGLWAWYGCFVSKMQMVSLVYMHRHVWFLLLGNGCYVEVIKNTLQCDLTCRSCDFSYTCPHTLCRWSVMTGMQMAVTI